VREEYCWRTNWDSGPFTLPRALNTTRKKEELVSCVWGTPRKIPPNWFLLHLRAAIVQRASENVSFRVEGCVAKKFEDAAVN